MSEYSDLIEKAREISSQTSFRAEALQTGFLFLILEELQRLNSNIEKILSTTVQPQMDTADKTDTMLEIERRFGKSIDELLRERKDKSIRTIADEFGISKSSVSEWQKKYLND